MCAVRQGLWPPTRVTYAPRLSALCERTCNTGNELVQWPGLLQGSAAYAPEKEALVWKIRNFPGGKEFLLRAKFGLPSVAAEDEATGRMPPIRVAYEVRGLS